MSYNYLRCNLTYMTKVCHYYRETDSQTDNITISVVIRCYAPRVVIKNGSLRVGAVLCWVQWERRCGLQSAIRTWWYTQ